ncbi:unnamed protein product, partial [Allacma fusca]
DKPGCSNPFNRHLPKNTRKVLMCLKPVKEKYLLHAQNLNITLEMGNLLCAGCRIHLKNSQKHYLAAPVIQGDVTSESDDNEPMEVDDVESSDDSEHGSVGDYSDSMVVEEKLKCIFNTLGLPFANKSSLRTNQTVEFITEGILSKTNTLLETFLGRKLKKSKESDVDGCVSCKDFVDNLRVRFESADTRAERYQILTATPCWVSIQKSIKIFGVSKRVAETASKLKSKYGPVSAPLPKCGAKLSSDLVALVQEFYLCTDNSRISPAQRDTVIIRKVVNGVKEKLLVPRQEMMCTLKDLHHDFIDKYRDQDVSISKSNLGPNSANGDINKDFRTRVLDDICLLGACPICPNFEMLAELVNSVEEEAIQFWKWDKCPTTGKIELQTKTAKKCELIDHLNEKILKVAVHHFVYKKQRDYINSLKGFNNISWIHGVLNVDFGQNYSFVLPNETQGFHWSNTQATIHPFVLYYKLVNVDDIKRMHFVVISDTLKHDATTFHAFRHHVVHQSPSRLWIKRALDI